MKNKRAFTLIEVLVSLFISSYIIFGMILFCRNIQKFINKSSSIMKFDRRVYTLFNLFEKDLSSCFIPKPAKIIKNKDDKKTKKTKKEQIYFLSEIIENEYRRIKGNSKKFELLKKINFVTTNSFTVYNEKTVRFLKVSYLLEKNKSLSKPDKTVYDLYRVQDFDLTKDSGKKDKKFVLDKFLIAQNIKHLSIEFFGYEKEDKNTRTNKEDKNKKMISSFIWGKDKKTQNVLPKKVNINVSFWDDNFEQEYSFNTQISTFIINLNDKKIENFKKKNVAKEKVEKS